MPEMISVNSTIIDSIGHEGATLYVKFKGGATYKYSNVSDEEYAEMLAAESVGKYFIHNIKTVKDYEKVEENGDKED